MQYDGNKVQNSSVERKVDRPGRIQTRLGQDSVMPQWIDFDFK
jgi:hypothetical protein